MWFVKIKRTELLQTLGEKNEKEYTNWFYPAFVFSYFCF